MSQTHNKAMVEVGATSGVAAMALEIDGGRTDVGSSLDASSIDIGRENKDMDSALLSRAGDCQKSGKNKNLLVRRRRSRMRRKFGSVGVCHRNFCSMAKVSKSGGCRGPPGEATKEGNSGVVDKAGSHSTLKVVAMQL